MYMRFLRVMTIAALVLAATMSADASGFFGRNRNCCTSQPICFRDEPEQVWSLYTCCPGDPTYQYRASAYDQDALRDYAINKLGCSDVSVNPTAIIHDPKAVFGIAAKADGSAKVAGDCICVIAKAGTLESTRCPRIPPAK